MSDPISITSFSFQDECDRLLKQWMGEAAKAQIINESIKEQHYTHWSQSHPIAQNELGHDTSTFKKLHQGSDDIKDDLKLVDDLWDMAAKCAHGSKLLSDLSDPFLRRLDAHEDVRGGATFERVAPQFSACLAASYEKALDIELPIRTGRRMGPARIWAMAALKVQ